MFEIDETLQKIIIIHILVCTFFYNYKPAFMFDNNNFLPFGTGPGKTIFPFWLVTTAISLLVYLFIVVKKDDFV